MGSGNRIYLNLRKALAVTVFHAIPFTALFLEHDYFVPFLVTEYSSFYFEGKRGFSKLDFPVAVNQKHLVERNGVALCSG